MNSIEDTTTRKIYVGCIGWTSNTVHAVSVNEYPDGKAYRGEPYALCAEHTSHHYRIGRANVLRRVDATKENVTCKNCLKRLALMEGREA